MANVRKFGPCDNSNFFNMCLDSYSPPLLKNLVLTNLRAFPFTNSWTSDEIVTMAYLVNFGRSLIINAAATPDRVFVYVATMGDHIGPALPQELFPAYDISERLFKSAVMALLRYPNADVYSVNSPVNYAAAIQDVPALYPEEGYGLHVPADAQINENSDISVFIRILRHIALGVTPAFRQGGLALISNIVTSICKRGAASVQLINKIEQGILTDLGKNVTLNADAIKIYYASYGKYITAGNMRQIVARWDDQVLRLSLNVQRVAGSGLTTFITIGRAMRMFPDFSWATIRAIFPTEFTNFAAAVRTVNGDVYYGFNRDLGDVKSTKFKNLAYVAKELLVKVKGETALNRYMGWVIRVPHQGRIDALIAEYKREHVVVDKDVIERADGPTQDVLDTVGQAVNNALFQA